MTARPYRVLLVSLERSLLRQGALMLEEFGYQATACADLASALTAAESLEIDFLLVDETAVAANWAQLAKLKQAVQPEHAHLMLLCGPGSSIDAGEAYQYGVDDFLRKPLNAGELLVRLRAGVRYGQFEQRLRQQDWRDAQTGLASRPALLDRAAQELRHPVRGKKLALLVVDLDLFEAFERRHGEVLAAAALREVATLLEQNASPGQLVARLEGNRFALLLPEHSTEKATRLGERLRNAVADMTLDGIDEPQLTASIGLATTLTEDEDAEGLLQRACEAVRDAKRSGRDCLVVAGQFAEETEAWTHVMRTGNPFASSTARDLMTPFALQLRGSDTVAFAAALFAQTRLELLPVVDFQGRFAGIVEREDIEEIIALTLPSAQPIEQVMRRDVPAVADSSRFDVVFEHFTRDDQPVLVVVRAHHALGFISRERFLGLVKPLSTDQFAPETFSSGTEYLVVPDLVEEAV